MALSKKFKLTQLVKATADLDDAVKYYNSKQHGVGIKFYLEYKKTLMQMFIVGKLAYFRILFTIPLIRLIVWYSLKPLFVHTKIQMMLILKNNKIQVYNAFYNLA